MTDDHNPNEGNPINGEPEEKKGTTTWHFRKRVATWARAAWLAITSKKASRVVTILQLVVVIFSAISILYQLRQQAALTRQQAALTRAANSQALVSLVSPMNMELVRNAEVAALWLRRSKGSGKPLDPKDLEEDRYDSLLATYLIFYENMYIQHEKKLLDDDVFAGWDKDVESFVEDQLLEEYWNEKRKKKYQADFSEHITKLMEAKKARRASSTP